MALINECLGCGKDVWHSARDQPWCERCSGKEAAKQAEAARWKALSFEEKLDELKTEVDALKRSSASDGLIG